MIAQLQFDCKFLHYYCHYNLCYSLSNYTISNLIDSLSSASFRLKQRRSGVPQENSERVECTGGRATDRRERGASSRVRGSRAQRAARTGTDTQTHTQRRAYTCKHVGTYNQSHVYMYTRTHLHKYNETRTCTTCLLKPVRAHARAHIII